MLMLLGRGVARCSAYALQAGRAVRRHSTRAPRVRATAADEVDLPYRGVLADLRLPDSLTDEDAFDAWAAEREERWTRDGALSGWLTLPPEKAALATHAWRRGFKLHHCAGDDLVLYKWLSHGEDKVPPWGNTQIGCAGFVVNDEGELLVVREWQPPKEGQATREPSQNWNPSSPRMYSCPSRSPRVTPTALGACAGMGHSSRSAAARRIVFHRARTIGIAQRGVGLAIGGQHRTGVVPAPAGGRARVPREHLLTFSPFSQARLRPTFQPRGLLQGQRHGGPGRPPPGVPGGSPAAAGAQER